MNGPLSYKKLDLLGNLPAIEFSIVLIKKLYELHFSKKCNSRDPMDKKIFLLEILFINGDLLSINWLAAVSTSGTSNHVSPEIFSHGGRLKRKYEMPNSFAAEYAF